MEETSLFGLNPATLSYALAVVGFVALFGQLAFGWKGGIRASVLLTIAALSILWAGVALWFLAKPDLFRWTIHAATDSARMGAWIAFLGILLTSSPNRDAPTWLKGVLCALPIAYFLAAWTWPVYIPVTSPLELKTTRVAIGLQLGTAIAGLVMVEQLFRRSRNGARWAIKPLCVGLGAQFVFDLYFFADGLLFSRIDPNVWVARGLAHATVIPFLVLATSRNRDWTIDVGVSRDVVFHSTALLATGVYLLAISGMGYYVRYFGGTWGQPVQIGFIFCALLLLAWMFVSGTLRSRLRVFISKHFFSHRFDYRKVWQQFTSVLLSNDPTEPPTHRCIRAIADLVESPGGALWLPQEDGNFTQVARFSMPQVTATVPAEGTFAEYMRRKAWIINLKEFRTDPNHYAGLEIPDWLAEPGPAWLVVPLNTASDALVGFIVLARPRATIDLDWEVRDLLKAAARQVGSYLSHIQTVEALLEAKKFESFSKMSAFVVHDLKNLVSQLGLLRNNAAKHGNKPEFQNDVIDTVANVRDRMSRLLKQLQSGGRPMDNPRTVELGPIVRNVVSTKSAFGRQIDVQILETVQALGHPERLERIVGHLVQNAIDATSESGSITVHVHDNGDYSVIDIIDTGHGMSDEFVRNRLFRPFQTTKSSGMGIGAYESAQYLKEIGGNIDVQSEPGKGTRVTMLLPKPRDYSDARHVTA